jgi:hypothetical protein
MTDVRPNRRQVLTSAGALGGLAALVSPIVACAQQAHGQQANGNAEGLEGAWLVTTTPEGPGAPPPFPVLIMFAAGGGLVDFAHPPSPGFGAWVRTGADTFALTFLALLFDPQGKFAGTQKVRAQAKLSQDGATYTGPGVTEMFDATGKLVATFKSQAHATRITVEPV